jgi:hypothetical protein
MCQAVPKESPVGSSSELVLDSLDRPFAQDHVWMTLLTLQYRTDVEPPPTICALAST